ncbi:hypothetical protein SCLCIDRAFT_1219585 [Scleroderma citrinum Foug A]|uniref:Uncharacterized protein n=1 Tax=Scleroderma citrinum Foug A TaxID=1036808 RepID=A0A0C3DLX0_9AGAM|nr:hypothetical protein SCLCIDRAFT_1219585 [Scleroderma citrinum Foug A]
MIATRIIYPQSIPGKRSNKVQISTYENGGTSSLLPFSSGAISSCWGACITIYGCSIDSELRCGVFERNAS